MSRTYRGKVLELRLNSEPSDDDFERIEADYRQAIKAARAEAFQRRNMRALKRAGFQGDER